MLYWEVTVKTTSDGIGLTADALTAMGFDSLVMDDQQEYLQFLEANRSCWDYVDASLVRRLEGLSQIQLYLGGMKPLRPAWRPWRRDFGICGPGIRTGTWGRSPSPPSHWMKRTGPTTGGKTIRLNGWEKALRAALLASCGRGPGPPAGDSGPGSHLRHRRPPVHPNVPGRPGAASVSRQPGGGPGYGQRRFVHCRPASRRPVRRGVDIDPKAEDMVRETAPTMA